MRALTVVPGRPDSASLDDVPEPPLEEGAVVVQTLAIGICGTDVEIVEGRYGWPPRDRQRLVLGHESLGRVLSAPADADLARGDLVVGIVRRPDPVPCANCAVGEWDMCRNGRYTERGIKERDGFGSERYRVEPSYAVKVDSALGRLGVLLEPASIVAKAWEHIERIGSRARWEPRRALVTGAGPIGLLAALLGTQRKLDVHVLDRGTSGPKPGLVRDLGASYHTGTIEEACPDADIVIEATGASELVFDAIEQNGPGSVVCLTGVSPAGQRVSVDAGALNREMVLQNDVVFGSVNANRRHYEAGAEALGRADRSWLERLITRWVPLESWQDALKRGPDDVKTAIEFDE